MSDRAKKITELTTTTSVANSDLFIIERVAANTTSAITGNNLATYVVGKVAAYSGTFSGNLTFSANVYFSNVVSAAQSTKASNDPGIAGQIAWDANYIYVCTASNNWKRALLESY